MNGWLNLVELQRYDQGLKGQETQLQKVWCRENGEKAQEEFKDLNEVAEQ